MERCQQQWLSSCCLFLQPAELLHQHNAFSLLSYIWSGCRANSIKMLSNLWGAVDCAATGGLLVRKIKAGDEWWWELQLLRHPSAARHKPPTPSSEPRSHLAATERKTNAHPSWQRNIWNFSFHRVFRWEQNTQTNIGEKEPPTGADGGPANGLVSYYPLQLSWCPGQEPSVPSRTPGGSRQHHVLLLKI